MLLALFGAISAFNN